MKIIDLENKQMWQMPYLSGGKCEKRVTRHYANLPLILSQDQYTLFSWLCYMTDITNTFEYNIKLLKQFKKASEYAADYYKINKITYSVSIMALKKSFTYLVENSLLIKINDNRFMINPYLMYTSWHGIYISKHVKECNRIMESADAVKEMQAYCLHLYGRLSAELNRLAKAQEPFNNIKNARKIKDKSNKDKRG